jgi:hypothetical protein
MPAPYDVLSGVSFVELFLFDGLVGPYRLLQTSNCLGRTTSTTQIYSHIGLSKNQKRRENLTKEEIGPQCSRALLLQHVLCISVSVGVERQEYIDKD